MYEMGKARETKVRLRVVLGVEEEGREVGGVAAVLCRCYVGLQ